jgi:hypothetical protein
VQHQFVVHGAGWGALVGWLSAFILIAPLALNPTSPIMLLERVSLLVIYPFVLGAPVGAAIGAVCGMGAAMAVGTRTNRRSGMTRAALGAMALPVVVALATRGQVVLLPAVAGTLLLLLGTPRILKDTAARRRLS